MSRTADRSRSDGAAVSIHRPPTRRAAISSAVPGDPRTTTEAKTLYLRVSRNPGMRAIGAALDRYERTRREHTRLYLAAEPTVRLVLQTKPGDRCGIRKALRGRDGIPRVYFFKCRHRSCPDCAPAWVTIQAARLFAAWGDGPVRVLRFEDSAAFDAYRRANGVRMRGPNATPGAAVFPVGYGRAVVLFLPGAGGLTDVRLGDAVLRVLEALPATPPEPRVSGDDDDEDRRDDPNSFILRPDATAADVEAAAEVAGIRLNRRGEGLRTYASWVGVAPVTDEQWGTFRELLENRPRAPGLLAA